MAPGLAPKVPDKSPLAEVLEHFRADLHATPRVVAPFGSADVRFDAFVLEHVRQEERQRIRQACWPQRSATERFEQAVIAAESAEFGRPAFGSVRRRAEEQQGQEADEQQVINLPVDGGCVGSGSSVGGADDRAPGRRDVGGTGVDDRGQQRQEQEKEKEKVIVDDVPAHLVGATGRVAQMLLEVGPAGLRPPYSPEEARQLMAAEREREHREAVDLPPLEVPCPTQ